MLNKQLIRILLFTSVLLWGGEPIFLQVAAQNNSKQTLTAYLRKLNAKYEKRISFSSTITDEFYLQIKDSAGTIEDMLDKVLADTNLGYRVVNGYYYIYKKKAPVVTTPVKTEPKKAVEKRKALPPVSSIPYQLVFPNQRIIPTLKFYTPPKKTVYPENPKLAIKTNLLYDATATINLGVEFAVADKWTMDVSGNLNNWSFSSGSRKWKHVLIQPELRYWLCERFSGHFVGVHLHAGLFNVGNLPALGGLASENMQQYRYQGYLYGGGFTYGYQWVIGNRWSVETSIGLGFAHVNYDKYPCGSCGRKIKNNSKNYFGPTKVSISLIYSIK